MYHGQGERVGRRADGLRRERARPYSDAPPATCNRILQGTKPGDLPVELPTKFDLAGQPQTAKALGLELSPTFIARADVVIE